MPAFFDPANYWLLLGIFALLLAGVDLLRAMLGKSDAVGLLRFFSLSCGILSVLAHCRMIQDWAAAGDLSALEGVSPIMGPALLLFVLFLIALNGLSLLCRTWKQS